MSAVTRYRQNRITNYWRAAPYAIRAGRTLGTMAKRLYNSYKSSRKATSSAPRSTGAIRTNLTYQNDFASLYRRRRAPRRVRRRARRSLKRFMVNLDKLQGMKMCLINGTSLHSGVPSSNNNAQVVWGISIYGYGNNTYATNTNEANGDVWWMMARENGGDPTAASASRKLRFRSCAMNVNVFNEAVPGEVFGAGDLMIDVYHVLCRQSIKNASSTGDPALLWDECMNELAGTNMPNPITNTTWNGVTPFDTHFGKYYIVKNVKRYRLEAGGYFNLTMRDAGNYVLNMDELLDIDHKRGVTEGYIFVATNPQYNATGNRYAIQCRMNYDKKYHYTETSTSQSQAGGETL